VVGYLAAGAVAVLVGVLLVRLLRRQVSAAAVGTAVAAAAVLELGFKHGFVRHGPGHEETYFMVAGFVLIALAAWFGRDRAVLVVGLCAIAMVPGTLRLYDPVAARNQLRSGLELLLDKPYRVDALAARQQLLRDRYQLPAAIVGAATGHPVQIDPWEASAAWAYKFDWHPVPVFQLYSAYTPYLDQLNADAIVRAPADQVVLEGVSGSIDDRNPWWESPRYRLALLCDYVPVAAEGSWTALRHGANRCDGARGLGSRTVAAGEQVDTPAVGPDEVLVALHADARRPADQGRAPGVEGLVTDPGAGGRNGVPGAAGAGGRSAADQRGGERRLDPAVHLSAARLQPSGHGDVRGHHAERVSIGDPGQA
jgi:hypothetical protein